MFKKILSLILSVSLILTQPAFAQGVAELNIGKYLNRMPDVKPDSFRPAHLRYISYDIASNDFKLLLDQGDAKLSNSLNSLTPKLQESTQELFNYFLIGLSLPNDKFWVNLRPDAPQQIIDPELEKTDMGKIMLEADLQLKKDTSSLTSPQNPEGKQYWDKLYKKAGELFGTENIPIPTITRPWIVPGEVIVRETENSSYVYKANLKVMLEEDYLKNSQRSSPNYKPLTSNYNFSDPRLKELNQYSTQLIKELILPRLTQEINTSKKYAQLRQVFFSLILSRWFKDKYKGKPGQYSSLIDSRNLDNLISREAWSKDYYFNEYKKSFQQGEYNLKEQVSTPTGQVIRSYVSGGANMTGRFIEGGFKGIGTSSPIDWQTASLIGISIALIAGGVTVFYKFIKKGVMPTADYIRKFKIIEGGINAALGYADKKGMLSADDAILLHKRFKNYQDMGVEEVIEIIEGTIKLLEQPYPKPRNKINQENRKRVITILDGSLKASGSSPLAPQEGASSAITADKEKVSNILINLSNLLPKEIRLKDKESMDAILKNIESGHTLIRWAEKTIDSLYDAWVEHEHNKLSRFLKSIVFWKMDPLRRILPADVLKPKLERKYPAIKKGFDAARSELNKISEGTTEFIYRPSVLPVQELPAKAEEAKLISDSKLSIIQIIDDYEETLFYSDAGLRIEILKELEEIDSPAQLEEFLKEEKGRLLDSLSPQTREDYLIIDGMYSAILNRITHAEAVSSQEGASSAVVLAEDDFGEEFNKAKSAVLEKLNRSELLHQDDKLKKLIEAIIVSIENTNNFIELVTAIRSTIKEYKESKDDSYFVEKILKEIAEVLKPVRNKLDKTPGINIDIQKIKKSIKPPQGIEDVLLDKQLIDISRKMFWEEEFTDDLKALNLLVECYGASSAVVASGEDDNISYKFKGTITELKNKIYYLGLPIKLNREQETASVRALNDIKDAIIHSKNFSDLIADLEKVYSAFQSYLPKDYLVLIFQNIARVLEPVYGWLENKVDLKDETSVNGPEALMEQEEFEAMKSFIEKYKASSSITHDEIITVVGGIDFTRINYLTRPMGSFQGLDLRLPLLSKAELEGIDIKQELVVIEQMINAKIDVSPDRLKRLLAAMSQKDAFTSQRETQLLPLLLRLCWLKEEKGAETTPDFRAVLLIADTGLFVEQGNTRHSLN